MTMATSDNGSISYPALTQSETTAGQSIQQYVQPTVTDDNESGEEDSNPKSTDKKGKKRAQEGEGSVQGKSDTTNNAGKDSKQSEPGPNDRYFRFKDGDDEYEDEFIIDWAKKENMTPEKFREYGYNEAKRILNCSENDIEGIWIVHPADFDDDKERRNHWLLGATALHPDKHTGLARPDEDPVEAEKRRAQIEAAAKGMLFLYKIYLESNIWQCGVPPKKT